MANAEATPLKQDQPSPLQPAYLAGMLFVALVAVVAARFFDGAIPVIGASLVGALVPKQQSRTVRAAIGVTAALVALFVVRMWPTAASIVDAGDAPSRESAHVLSWLLEVPIGGAIAVLFLPRQSHDLLRMTTLLVMLASLAVALPLLGIPMGRAYHFNEYVVWMPRFGIHYHVAIDGISLWLVMLTVFITPIAAFASFGSIHVRLKDWCFALLLLEGAMLGAFVSADLFLFYVFWELMLIPMYVMIGVWGGTDRIRSAMKFFIYTMFGSVLMLGAVLYVAYAYAEVNGGQPSFDYFDLKRL
ncbi:MAG: proton-conducting transporter membrane subunit, partial [Polyangiaceae bacterium]